MAEPKPVTLYERINRVKGDITRVHKSGENRHFGFRYATESDISDLVRPLMAKHGVCLVYHGPDPDRVEIISGQTAKGGANNLYRIWVKYELVNTDNPTERESVLAPGEALDGQDKGMNKALTAAAKYAWLKIFDISTGDQADEPDSHGYDGDTISQSKVIVANTMGTEGRERIIDLLTEHGLSPADLIAELKSMGFGSLIAGVENLPGRWPTSLKQHVLDACATASQRIASASAPAEPTPPPPSLTVKKPGKTEPALGLMKAVEKQWKEVWYPGGQKPQVGFPKTPVAVVDAMMRGDSWATVPQGLRMEKMIEDLNLGRVMSDGTLLPF